MRACFAPLILIVGLVMACRAAQTPSGSLRRLEAMVGPHRKLVALAPCPLEKYKADYLCLVTEAQDVASAAAPPRRLTIYPAKAWEDPNAKVVFEFNTADALLALYPNGGDKLVTLWESGSALRINIFAQVGGVIKRVFEASVKTPPELVDLDNDGSDELLVSQGEFLTSGGKVVSYPKTTDIYKWDGSAYYRVKTVNWPERLQALKPSSASGAKPPK